MANIADIGRRQFADQMAGKMRECTVSEWLDENAQPVKVYWRPLTGLQQIEIDRAGSEVDRVCQLVKTRALDAQGRAVFADVPLASLKNDYDYDVIRAIAYIIAGNIGQNADETIEEIESE